MGQVVLGISGEAVREALAKAPTDVSTSSQELTDAQKEQARKNIGASPEVNAVLYTTQTLDTTAKAQARTNIGACSDSDLASLTSQLSTLESAMTNKITYNSEQTYTALEKAQARKNIGLNIDSKGDNMNVSVGLDENGKLWATALQTVDVDDFHQVQQIVQGGGADVFFAVGDQFVVNKATSLTTAIKGGITSATVNLQTFIEKVGVAEAVTYSFVYNGAAWIFEGKSVTLSDYGINITGSPTALDVITITEACDTITFDVLDFDYDTPIANTITHSMSLLTHDVYTGDLQFDKGEMLYYVDPEIYPTGLQPGTYSVTLLNGAHDGSVSQDGTYYFTTLQVVPPSGYIRHTTMGVAQTTYSSSQILAGNFITYDDDYTQIESLTTLSSGTGTSLGTTTAHSISGKTSELLNFTDRVANGSNNYHASILRQYLNSKAAPASSGSIALWWEAQNNWDMPLISSRAGFLYGLDPSFVNILQTVKKRTKLTTVDRDTTNYTDTEEKVFTLSETEVELYEGIPAVYETSFGTDKTYTTVLMKPYAYYKNAENSDRIKYASSVAKAWWLRTPNDALADLESTVTTTGASGGITVNNLVSIAIGVAVG